MTAPVVHLAVGTFELPPAPNMEAMLRGLERGLLMGGELARGVWIRVAQGLDLHDTGAYIRGIAVDGRIEVERANFDPAVGVFTAVLAVTNVAKHAPIIEDGHAAFHLPSRINWSGPRVKRGKNGRPYMHIPFRHAAFVAPDKRAEQGTTRNALRRMLPEDVYQKAKNLGYVRPLRVGPIRSETGQFMAADRYQQPTQRWRRRLDRSHVRAQIVLGAAGTTGAGAEGYEERRGARQVGRDAKGPLINPAWSASKLHGLFKSGSKGHTSYMTVRTITPTSQGWNIPAQVGHGVARRVAAALQAGPELRDIVEAAMREGMGGGPA